MLTGALRTSMQEKLVYGHPAAEALDAELARLERQRAFLISTRSLAGSRLRRGIIASLGSRLRGSYEQVASHTPRGDVVAAVDAARRADTDVIVALGGGSVIDAAKAVQLGLTRGVSRATDLDGLVTGIKTSSDRSAADYVYGGPRIIAVPTTLSGAEFTPFAGVTDETTGMKQIFHEEILVPQLVILDPAATLDTPLPLLLATGVRAVDHCVECFCAPDVNPIAEAYAVGGLRLLLAALPALRAAPASIDLRLRCQLGAAMGILGPATGVSVGASHGIGRILGGRHGIPHGHTSCVLLAPVLRWNAPVNAGRQLELAHQVGAGGRELPAIVEELVDWLGAPRRLRDVGVRDDQLAGLAAAALASGFLQHNPRPIHAAGDVEAILRDAW